MSAAYRCRDPRLSGRFCSPYSSRGRGDDWPRRPRCAVRAGCVVEELSSACWTLTDAAVTYGVRSKRSRGQCDVGGGAFVSVRVGRFGVVWRLHACTSSAAHFRWGARPPRVAGRCVAVVGAVRWSEERSGTLRNVRERCDDHDASHSLWSGPRCGCWPSGWESQQGVNPRWGSVLGECGNGASGAGVVPRWRARRCSGYWRGCGRRRSLDVGVSQAGCGQRRCGARLGE